MVRVRTKGNGGMGTGASVSAQLIVGDVTLSQPRNGVMFEIGRGSNPVVAKTGGPSATFVPPPPPPPPLPAPVAEACPPTPPDVSVTPKNAEASFQGLLENFFNFDSEQQIREGLLLIINVLQEEQNLGNIDSPAFSDADQQRKKQQFLAQISSQGNSTLQDLQVQKLNFSKIQEILQNEEGYKEENKRIIYQIINEKLSGNNAAELRKEVEEIIQNQNEDNPQGKYFGIGVNITKKEDGLLINSVFTGSSLESKKCGTNYVGWTIIGARIGNKTQNQNDDNKNDNILQILRSFEGQSSGLDDVIITLKSPQGTEEQVSCKRDFFIPETQKEEFKSPSLTRQNSGRALFQISSADSQSAPSSTPSPSRRASDLGMGVSSGRER